MTRIISELRCARDEGATLHPERLLLLAILERAVRDLGTRIDIQERRKAISWFNYTKAGSTVDFTFKQIVEELDLNAAQVCFIKNLVQKAEEECAKSIENEE